VDPEFQRILGRVLLVGGAMGVIGAGILIVAFRAFGSAPWRGGELRAVVLIVGLLAFVLLCCAVLVLFSAPHPS
jgi:hypothetical protein